MQNDVVIEEFPYPTTITREDFQQQSFEPDSFLFEHHRYTSIDVLIKDLTALLAELRGELLNIVNNDYTDFIKLGRSIDGGMDHINSMLLELKDFRKLCLSSESNLNVSKQTIERSLTARAELIAMKNNVKLCLLLSSQIETFENLLSTITLATTQSATPVDLIVIRIKRLTTIYLSINKLYAVLSKLPNDQEIQYVVNLKIKVSNIGSEFRNYLNEELNKYKSDKLENKLIIFELMRIYKVIGHGEDFINVLKE